MTPAVFLPLSRPVWRGGTVGLIVLALLILFSVTFSAQPLPPCDSTQGHVERYSYRSARISTDMTYTVYTPPCYDSPDAQSQTYPVLYLMHGSNSDDSHWLQLGLREALDERITRRQMPPVIAVLPFGNWIANENRFDIGSWEYVFLGELMPHAESRLRIDTQQRLIGGISRGGFWAYLIGLRHPRDFIAIGGHSAFFAKGIAPADYDPLETARTLSASDAPALWLDRGFDDYAADGLDLMHARLDSAALPHEYTLADGEHDNRYWSRRLPDYLDWYAAQLTRAQNESPATFATQTPAPDGLRVYLPVVAFPSTQTSLTRATFNAALQVGDSKLTLSEDVYDALTREGYAPTAAQVVDSLDAVYATLWRDRSRWSILPFDALTLRYRVLWLDDVHPLDALADYPLAFRSGAPNFHPERLTRITASGVTALTRNMIPVLDARGVDWAAEAIAPILSRSDFVHVSNEVSLHPDCPAGGERLGGNSSFCSKPEHFALLEKLGVDIVELSGNHNNDYGYEAYLDTLDWYAQRGIRTVGGGRTLEEARAPLIIEHNGNSIAWVSCNWIGPYYALVDENPNATGGARPGAAFCDREWLSRTLPQLSITHDLLIISVQYQEFDQYTPTDSQRDDFAQLAAWGADIVLGTQAHFPQTYTFAAGMGERESFIHYGLGNFLFDQTFWAGVRFLLDRLFIYEGRLVSVDIMPGIIEEGARPRLMNAEERLNFLHVLFVQNGGL